MGVLCVAKPVNPGNWWVASFWTTKSIIDAGANIDRIVGLVERARVYILLWALSSKMDLESQLTISLGVA